MEIDQTVINYLILAELPAFGFLRTSEMRTIILRTRDKYYCLICQRVPNADSIRIAQSQNFRGIGPHSKCFAISLQDDDQESRWTMVRNEQSVMEVIKNGIEFTALLVALFHHCQFNAVAQAIDHQIRSKEIWSGFVLLVQIKLDSAEDLVSVSCQRHSL